MSEATIFASYSNRAVEAENEQNRRDALRQRFINCFCLAYMAAGEWLDKDGAHGSEEQQEANAAWFSTRFNETVENLDPEEYRLFCAWMGPAGEDY